MEGIGGDGASAAAPPPPPVNQWWQHLSKLYQFYLDESTPHTVYRWIGTVVLAAIYVLRIYYVQGFPYLCILLGYYIEISLVEFLNPLVDPKLEPSDGPVLPTKGSVEFKTFIRRFHEFKFWYSCTKAFCIAFVMTFFSICDVTASWFFLILLSHMIFVIVSLNT
ncbi:Protein RER1 [Quillaja saponaria]|uniref:Protein RER1 n=1 Tax=Quillaja saponaria TaxID=32244 RepID=A0AAD7M067_QUISA|nr:Protein RER1 [Quillaja saponaria]